MKSFLAKAAPADSSQLSGPLDICDGVTFASANAYYSAHQSGLPVISPTDFMSCQNAISTIDAYLTAHESALVTASSSDELALARLNLRALRAWEGQIYNHDTNVAQSLLERDSGMADVFLALKTCASQINAQSFGRTMGTCSDTRRRSAEPARMEPRSWVRSSQKSWGTRIKPSALSGTRST